MAKSEPERARRTAPLPLDLWTDTPPAVDPRLADWLLEPGLLTARLATLNSRPPALRVVRQSLEALATDLRALLGAGTENGLLREIELAIDGSPLVFAQTLVPDDTLAFYPWLAELGDSPLGEMLATLDGVRRERVEFAELPAVHPLAERAQRNVAAAQRETLPARRTLVSVRGRRLLIQELFLPALHRRVTV